MSVSPKLIVNIVPVLANSPRVILRDLSETKAGRRALALLPAAVSRGEWIRTTGLFVPKHLGKKPNNAAKTFNVNTLRVHMRIRKR